MQEHYDEFFEVREHRVFGPVEGDLIFFMPLCGKNWKVTMNLSNLCWCELCIPAGQVMIVIISSQEVFTEMEEKYGEVEEMNVCDNLGDHLVGNVYVKVGIWSFVVN